MRFAVRSSGGSLLFIGQEKEDIMRYLAPIPNQYLDATGEPCAGGSVAVYVSGENRFANIYQNSSGDELVPNPCELDSHGMWQAFVDADLVLDYIVKDSGGYVVAEYYAVSFPTAGGSSAEVSIESPNGTIDVTESTVDGVKKFEIDVNDKIAKPHSAKFSHEATAANDGTFEYDNFTLESDVDTVIYLTNGVLTLDKGLYHLSVNLVLGNSSTDASYYDVVFSIAGNDIKTAWDNSFVHEKSLEVGFDLDVDEDGHTEIPTISGLPAWLHCDIVSLDVHKVATVGMGGAITEIEHDPSIVGDGTLDHPLGVKNYDQIVNSEMKIAVGADGSNEMTFYKGTLVL